MRKVMPWMLMALVLAGGAAPAAAKDKKDWWVSGKMGFNLGGDINVDPPDVDVDVDPHFLMVGDVDKLVAHKLSLGGRLKLGFPSVGGEGETYFGFGPTLKVHFRPDSKLALNPGVALLFQSLSGSGGGGSATGMGLDFFLEAATPVSKELDLVGELGFNTQPVGHGDGRDVTWGPMFHLLFGVRY